MKRTTISMPDEMATALHREARRREVSVSEVTREALSKHLGFGATEERRVISFAAIGRSGHANTARDVEAILAEEWPDHILGDH